MSRYLMSFVAAALVLAVSGPAFAGTHVTHYSSGRSFTTSTHVGPNNYVSHNGIAHNNVPINPYHLNYGHKFNNGYYYAGPYHHHWTYCSWYGRYVCNCYWCPSTSCWYYWCAPQNCYYPINYINIAPPARRCAGGGGIGRLAHTARRLHASRWSHDAVSGLRELGQRFLDGPRQAGGFPFSQGRLRMGTRQEAHGQGRDRAERHHRPEHPLRPAGSREIGLQWGDD